MIADRVRGAFAVLDVLPAVNAKIVTAITLAGATALVYFALALTGRDATMNVEAFGLWLGFVLSFAGVAAWTYGKKRDTYASPSPDSDRAGVTDGVPKEVG